MATKAQVTRELAKRGLEIWPGSLGYDPTRHLGDICIDAIGANQIDGECRGHVISLYITPAAKFWDEVLLDLPTVTGPCPDPENCDLHGDG